MLRVFPITLKGPTLRWKKWLPVRMINTWDLLEKEFIWQYCSHFKTSKKLEEIRNFKQEIDETLYHAWKRYSDLLYSAARSELPTEDNIDAIQESFKEAHPTIQCPLKKEDTAVEQREKFKARTTMGKENMKEPVPRDLPPTPFLGHSKEQIGSPYRTRKTICMIENHREVHKLKAQEDEGDMNVGWDITVKDVERLRPVHDKEKIVRKEEHDYDIPLRDGVMQPLTPQIVHITPPDDDYVTPTTCPTLDKQLNEFGKEWKWQMITLLKI
ncbi:calmodulin-interacting protein 111 isoform X1 [Tanacetum coccineum]